MKNKEDFYQTFPSETAEYQTVNKNDIVAWRSPEHPTHHDTSLFTHKNPILATAGKLLNIITQIKLNKDQRPAEKLNTKFEQEKTHFEQKLNYLGYDKDNILISSYIIDTCMIAVTEQHAASVLKTSDSDTKPATFLFNSKRFFVVLEKICKNPTTFIDTIELVYVCLNLALEETTKQANYWTTLKDQLYLLIQIHRDDSERKLSPPIREKTFITPLLKRSLWVVLIETTVSVIFIIGCIYAITGYLFKSYLTPFSHNLQTMTQKIQTE